MLDSLRGQLCSEFCRHNIRTPSWEEGRERWWRNSGRGIREEGEGETGRSGKRKSGRVHQPFDISPASKHSNCSITLKNFFLLSPSPLLPSLQALLFIILDKLNLIITTSCIESQTKPYNNYSCKPELGRGRADPLHGRLLHTQSVAYSF